MMEDKSLRERAVNLKRLGKTYGQIGIRLGVCRQRAASLVSPEPRVRSVVKRRSGGMCQSCFQPRTHGFIPHHRTIQCPPEVYNTPRNLLWVCASCHPLLEGNTLVVLD